MYFPVYLHNEKLYDSQNQWKNSKRNFISLLWFFVFFPVSFVICFCQISTNFKCSSQKLIPWQILITYIFILVNFKLIYFKKRLNLIKIHLFQKKQTKPHHSQHVVQFSNAKMALNWNTQNSQQLLQYQKNQLKVPLRKHKCFNNQRLLIWVFSLITFPFLPLLNSLRKCYIEKSICKKCSCLFYRQLKWILSFTAKFVAYFLFLGLIVFYISDLK